MRRKTLKHICHAKMQASNDTIRETMLDLGATSNFIQSMDRLELTGLSSKTISMASRHIMQATMPGLAPLRQLKAGAQEAIIVPGLSMKVLMSVKQLADQGYTKIFHSHLQGVTIYDNASFKFVTTKQP